MDEEFDGLLDYDEVEESQDAGTDDKQEEVNKQSESVDDAGKKTLDGVDAEKKKKFEELQIALRKAKEERDRRKFQVSEDKVGVSCTLLLKNLTDNVCVEAKIKEHFSRYGTVESVRCDKDRLVAIVCFSNKESTGKAFFNRAPVFRDTAIRVFRVPDHRIEDQAKAEGFAKAAPNRVATERKPQEDEQGVAPVSHDEGASETVASSENAGKQAKNPVGQSVGVMSLYSNINIPDAKSQTKGPTERPRLEKRTWARAGLANMNDKEVLRAKIKEKQAMRQVHTAKAQVEELMKELNKQKDQFKLLGNSAQTIGKNLRAELMGNIKLLMSQLHHAQGSMKAAKEAVAVAKTNLQVAIENSKTKEAKTTHSGGAATENETADTTATATVVEVETAKAAPGENGQAPK